MSARALLSATFLCAAAACGDDGAGPAAAADAGHDAAAPNGYDGPTRLSETSLYADVGAGVLAPDVVAYDVRFPLWSDGSAKARHLALPPGGTIDTSDPDAWVFPVGTRAWKTFTRDGVRVETRYLEKRADGWEHVAFIWAADGTDAVAAPDGEDDARGTGHDVPSRADCRSCHDGARDMLLGVGAIQQTGEGRLIERLTAEGRLSAPPPAGGHEPPGGPADAAALGYLHANCGSCHSPFHPLAGQRAMRLHLPVGLAAVADAPAVDTTAGVEAFHHIADTHVLLVPGDPAASQLLVRAGARDPFTAMPPVGTELVDADGLALLEAWIRGLE